jgi:dTDP-4-dehydrorhamnose reductase
MRGQNFLLTILRLARERPELRVVDDQDGAPTWCRDIAVATVRLLAQAGGRGEGGLFHLTAAGRTTWCGFAREILRARDIATPVKAIASSEYPTPARRPANSLLSAAKLAARYGVELPDWRASLLACLAESA